MAQLTAANPRVWESTDGHPSENAIPAVAAVAIYAGSAVGESGATGTGRQLVALDNFMGFANETCDNTAGAAGAKLIKVLDKCIVKLTVVGVTGVGDYDAPVYASDGNTFTLTSTSNTQIGKIKRVISGTTCLVECESTAKRSV